MASGSSGRANAGSKGFDFASDDILCPYEDYPNQESSNGSLSDPVISASSGKDFHNRRARSPVYSAAAYTQPEDSFNQDVISVVDKSMKRNTENLMRFLEGISSRLSQLELYCYNLDKSIGEMRSDLVRDHGESDSKLKAIEKHLQEVHRSVQILRDKQELADTQKELAKLQLGQKDSTSSTHSQSTEGRASPTISESKKNNNQVDSNNQQLALALPHQVAPAQPPPPPAPTQNVPRQPAYYLPAPQLPNPPAPPPQHQQPQYVSPDSQYPRVAQQQAQPQVNQTPPVQQYPQYPPQPLPQQVQLPQQPPMQSQLRPQSHVYPSYVPGQATNPPPETLPNSMPMQVPYPGIPQPGTSRADVVPFGYAGPGRASPQQPPPQIKGGYGAQPGDGYGASGPHPALPPGSTYMMYDGEGNRAHYQPQVQHFSQGGGYPPSSAPPQNLPPNSGPNLIVRNPQFMRNHPYGELIEKLASMGFRPDHVVGVIQRMEESGQPIDFNAVLDRLNVHSSGAPQRGWSG